MGCLLTPLQTNKKQIFHSYSISDPDPEGLSIQESALRKTLSLTPLFFALIEKMTTPKKLSRPHIFHVYKLFVDATFIFTEAALLANFSYPDSRSLIRQENVETLREKVIDYLNHTETPYALEIEDLPFEETRQKLKLMGKICAWVEFTMRLHWIFITSSNSSSIPYKYKAFHITRCGEEFLKDFYQNGVRPHSVTQLAKHISTLRLTNDSSCVVEKKVPWNLNKPFNEVFFTSLCEQRFIIPLHVANTTYVEGKREFIKFYLPFCIHGDARNPPYKHQTELDFLKTLSNPLEALAYMHSMGVVHNDVKPGNIFFTGGLRDKPFPNTPCYNSLLGDLGGATFEGTPVYCGTIPYMPPERLLSDKALPASPKTDMWSFGVTLFEMLNRTKVGLLDYNIPEENTEQALLKSRKAFYLKHIPNQAALDAHLANVKKRASNAKSPPRFPFLEKISGMCSKKRASNAKSLPRFPFLEGIAEMCLKYDPNERPTSQEILDLFSKRSAS